MLQQYSYQLSITPRHQHSIELEILRDVLLNLGIPPSEITELQQNKETMFLLYFPTRAKALALSRQLKGLIKNLRLTIERLKKTDWETKWKEDFKPFALTQTFAVVPTWCRKTYKPRGLTPIYIDSVLAFGTGLHPTTRYVSRFIEQRRGQFKDFLDLGTGTGILAMIAHYCGAEKITAIDYSPDSIATARTNFEENEINGIKLLKKDVYRLKINHQYDFVAANLITDDLLNIRQKLLSLLKPGAYLAVSGISIHNARRFQRVFKTATLRCLKIERGEGWTAFFYKKIR